MQQENYILYLEKTIEANPNKVKKHLVKKFLENGIATKNENTSGQLTLDGMGIDISNKNLTDQALSCIRQSEKARLLYEKWEFIKDYKYSVLYTCNTFDTLLETVDAGEKTIVPFCTFGSGGLESSYIDIKKNCPDANIKDGFGIRNARISKAAKEVDRFLIAGGFKEGEVENIPEFPEQQEVGDEEIAIFNAACSSYPMPLGSPVSFASRETSDGKEFLYTAVSQGRDGNKSYSKVYVVVGNEEGSVPEFTKVLR